MYRPPYTDKPKGRPVITRFQHIDNEEHEIAAIVPSELQRVARMIAGALDLEEQEGLKMISKTVHYANEIRLKFNAPTPVHTWHLEVTLGDPQKPLFSGEVELFHWLQEDSWELVEIL